MEMNKTGRLIEQLRKEKCMTQSDLAAAVGVSKQAVSNWECGKRIPDVVLIEKLADELGIGVAELIKGERLDKGSINADDAGQLVHEALKIQKKELSRRWRLITLICVALTAMLCLGREYAFFWDKVILLNFNTWNAIAMIIAMAFGVAIRCCSADNESFYKYALTAMAAWIVCESFAAIGFTKESVSNSVFGLVITAAEFAWYILCGLAGAWAAHLIIVLWQVKRK